MSEEEKYEAQVPQSHSDDDEEDGEEIIFGGQIPRAPTQVTGLTNDERSKKLMTLSTAKVNTQATGHMKASPYVPDSDLFQFSNPDRPDDDLDIAQNQIYKDEPLTGSGPTFTKPTAARPHPTANRYAQHLTFKGDKSTEILFGRFTQKSSCFLLVCSTILAGLFCYIAAVFFPQFGTRDCSTTCLYAQVPTQSVKGVMDNQVTLINACESSFLMFSFTNSTLLDEYSFAQLEELDSDNIEQMYIGGTDYSNPSKTDCWEKTQSSKAMNGYVEIDYDAYVWEWSASGWYMALSFMMALFFVLIEWLFYSYNEIMIPRKDYRAYIMWYGIRMGWMSYMFAIIIAHSLMVASDGVTFIIGEFDYGWVNVDCYIATGYVSLFVLICLCCCCFQESDGFSGGNPFSSPDDFGFERFFLPQSRIDLLVINEFEQGLGTAMCTTMIFVIGFIICGAVPFIEFLSGGVAGYTYFPYIVSIWFLAVVAMTFQMCWFVRARCCGDDEDKIQAQIHERQVQRVATP